MNRLGSIFQFHGPRHRKGWFGEALIHWGFLAVMTASAWMLFTLILYAILDV